MSTRFPSHAGSWYNNNANTLRSQLEKNLSAVHAIPGLNYDPPIEKCKALIGPHAGYSYSGPAAAWAYAAVPTDSIKTVFLLGPSHHHHLSKIALSRHAKYGTPLGDILLDGEVITQLNGSGMFDLMDNDTDEDEHSLEMHLPYIRHIFGARDDFKLVPLLVGSVSAADMKRYADVLGRFWDDPGTFWVISSDFCHWGTRFSHTPYYASPPPIDSPVPPVTASTSTVFGTRSSTTPELVTLSRGTKLGVPIWESIQYMDHEAMNILRGAGESGTSKKFREYLRRTGNTICGRNPILQLLAILERTNCQAYEVEFVRYEQSSKCESIRDSSVSYVGGLVVQRE